MKTLTHTPVLALPDFSKALVMENDASKLAPGVIPLQEQHPTPTTYYS